MLTISIEFDSKRLDSPWRLQYSLFGVGSNAEYFELYGQLRDRLDVLHERFDRGKAALAEAVGK